ncbi:MAG: Hdr-like menaquinol oxidoreductase cytochrome c subunit [Magnetococcales bacterium]|nr:Hdr-like menaquinol oxidoreductase cytochrome c subunit [Magnetococcales bacterium]
MAALAVLLSGVAPVAAGGPVNLQKPKGEACIRPTDWMRRNHMQYLKSLREETVRQGVRQPKESLQGCPACHQSRTQFCDRCHTYVGVAPDCFECHNYPE